MPDSSRKLHAKLAEVMGEAERIPKRGKAPPAMGGYPFVQVGDAADYIRNALASRQVTMMPTDIDITGHVDRPTRSGGTMTTVDLRVTWTLTDGETGETFAIQSFGAGADGGDKYSGKAMTSAMKYAFLAGFLLSTGDDTEQSDTSAVVHETPASLNAKERERVQKHFSNNPPASEDGSLIGTGDFASDFRDFLPKQGPDGMQLAFKLVSDHGGYKVLVHGLLAEILPTIKDEIIGKRISCWGRIVEVPYTGKRKDGTTFSKPYLAIDLERIKTESGTLPMVEAESAPLFTGPEFE